MKAVQNRNGLRTLSHSRIPPVTPQGVGLAALAVGVSIHDIIEDVNGYDYTRVSLEFGEDVAQTVMCVTKIEGEKPVDYLKRFTSTELSSLVKVLDQLNNVATLSGSSLAHREKVITMAENVYLPLLKRLRQRDWMYGRFYFQTRTIISTIVKEVKRGNSFEHKYNAYCNNTFKEEA